MLEITNMTQFNKEVDRVMGLVEQGLEDKVLKKIAMDTHRNLQKRTPRMSGRARAGWNTVVDGDPSEWAPPEGKKRYSQTAFSGLENIKFNSLINLSNNVEYIVPLNEGHSKQASNIVPFVISKVGTHLASLLAKESKRKIK
jgi:hypothetical protein